VVEFTESTEGKDEVDTADMARIMDVGGLIIETGDDGVEFLARVNRPVDVESVKVDIDDDLEHDSVLGQPD